MRAVYFFDTIWNLKTNERQGALPDDAHRASPRRTQSVHPDARLASPPNSFEHYTKKTPKKKTPTFYVEFSLILNSAPSRLFVVIGIINTLHENFTIVNAISERGAQKVFKGVATHDA